ncbi:MAG: ribonuclease M5 [Candidatus Izemoplasma sp.]|nr:ribonuclease M5 [Candidatus Izemoplasma sp.]
MDLKTKTINEVVVVEGYHDLARIKHIFPDCDVVITNGSEISQTTLDELKQLNDDRGLILLLDPDMQGERIRRVINDYVGETRHAFIPKVNCISKNKKKVGIEHASDEDIIEAMNHIRKSHKQKQKTITLKDLTRLGLMGSKDAKRKRQMLAEHFHIGPANAKTFCKKLNMFHITLEDITQALEVK